MRRFGGGEFLSRGGRRHRIPTARQRHLPSRAEEERPTSKMPVVISDEPWVPAQEKFESGADYRSFDAGRMSRKRAREVEENGIEDDEMVDEHEMERLRKASRPTYKQVVGKASGRAWKEPAKQRAASFMNVFTSSYPHSRSWSYSISAAARSRSFTAAGSDGPLNLSVDPRRQRCAHVSRSRNARTRASSMRAARRSVPLPSLRLSSSFEHAR